MAMITDALQVLRPGEEFHFENGIFVFKNKKVVIPTEKEIEDTIADLTLQAKIVAAQQGIEDFIYSKYSQKKQAQDNTWNAIFRTKLNALGVEDLDLKIVSAVRSFFKGIAFDEVIKTVASDQQEMFGKLVKIAIRTEWASMCVTEGITSIKEDRAAKYQEYPTL